jgi:hypothetical protein
MPNDFNDAVDSDGVRHRIYTQEETMSCALACLFMIENQYELATHVGGEGRMKDLSGNYPDSLLASQLSGDNNGLGNGTGVYNTSSVLPVVGVPCHPVAEFAKWKEIQISGKKYWEISDYKFQLNYQNIKDQRPALFLIAWLAKYNNKWLHDGGHFIVAARKTKKNYIVVLDPADATLHELQGKAGVYRRNGSYGLITHALYTK